MAGTRLITILRRWLEWQDSHDGRLHRRAQGGEESDLDLLCLIPNPPGQALVTVGDLRELLTSYTETEEELARQRGRAKDLEDQLVWLASWCQRRLGVDNNSVIGRDGWPDRLVEVVSMAADQELERLKDLAARQDPENDE